MSIQEHLNKIRNAIYGREVRESIAKGIETAYDDASEKDNANMEVKLARGTNPNLNTRLNKMDETDQQTNVQLAQTPSYSEARLKSEDIGLNDAAPDLLSAIQNKDGETTFNLQSIPRPYSVSPLKLNFAELSSNIYTKVNEVQGKLIRVDGTVDDDPSYSMSDYIAVEPNSIYTYGDIISVAYYDIGKNFISRASVLSEPTTQTPEDAHFIRVNHQRYGNQQINRGSQLLPYEEPYLEIRDFRTPASSITGNIADEIGSNEITFDKRTGLGDMGIYTRATGSSPVDIDTNNSTIKLSHPFYVTHGNRRYSSSSLVGDVVVPYPRSVFVFLVFDFETETFRAIQGQDIFNLAEEEVTIMTLNFDSNSGTNLEHVHFTNDYTVNGVKPNSGGEQQSGSVSKYDFAPEDLIGWYQPLSDSDYNEFDFDTTTAMEYIQKWNTLASNHDNYIVETLKGNDQSDTFPIYSYLLKPQDVDVRSGSYTETIKPRITIASGLHGSEKASVFALFYFIRDLCENWQGNEALEFLRHNVEFEIMPLVNPHGFENSNRANSRGVDINRNFDTPGWVQYSDSGFGTTLYAGEEPFSEVEARYVRDMLLNNPHTLLFIDYHTKNDTGNSLHDLMWMELPTTKDEYIPLFNATKSTIRKQTRLFKQNYGQPDERDFFGYITTNTSKSDAKNYAYEQGLLSTLVEGFRKFPNDSEYYNPKAIRANAEFFGNRIVAVLKMYKNQG